MPLDCYTLCSSCLHLIRVHAAASTLILVRFQVDIHIFFQRAGNTAFVSTLNLGQALKARV